MAGSTKLMTPGGGGLILTPASNIASDVTVSIPSVNGTAVIGNAAVSVVGQIPFSTDGTTFTPTAKIVSGTAVASTSGTSIDFTGIPSWVKRITVMFNGVSTTGVSNILIRIGTSSGFVVTGYLGSAGYAGTSIAPTSFNNSTGFLIDGLTGAANTRYGNAILTLLGSNTWIMSASMGLSDALVFSSAGGSLALSGTIDRIRITTVNGTDTFDAGSINILYE